MNKYDQFVDWLYDHWITTAILLCIIVLMAIPQVRDGFALLWSFVKSVFKKKVNSDTEIILKNEEETITFTELLRSLRHDVVKVHAHTHILGVAAEYGWIRRRYPGSKTVKQALTTLDLIAGKKKYKTSKIYFDIITIELPNGRKKEIFFDISNFYDGTGSKYLDPHAFIGKKIAQLYEEDLHRK
jgi:hypothetical protein